MASTIRQQRTVSEMEKSFARLDALQPKARDLHYRIAKECAFLLANEDFLQNKQQNHDRLRKRVEDLLPGMALSTLAKMFDLYPDKTDWEVQGVVALREKIHAQFRKTDATITVPPETEDDPVEVRAHVRGGPKPMEHGDENSPLSGEAERLRMKVLELSSKLDQANAKLVEVMMERDDLRAEVAKLRKVAKVK